MIWSILPSLHKNVSGDINPKKFFMFVFFIFVSVYRCGFSFLLELKTLQHTQINSYTRYTNLYVEIQINSVSFCVHMRNRPRDANRQRSIPRWAWLIIEINNEMKQNIRGKMIDRYVRNYAITDLHNFGIAGFRSKSLMSLLKGSKCILCSRAN